MPLNRPTHSPPRSTNGMYGGPSHRARVQLFVVFVVLAILVAGPVVLLRAEVYHSKESALRLAFPDADTVEKRQLFLTDEQMDRVEKLSGASVASRLVTVYVGHCKENILGYAFIETHQVRTLPETILIVIGPDGRARGVHMLAFHEPPEYAPTERWLGQFGGRSLTDRLSLRGDVDGITGATLTADAITAAVRRTLAVFEAAVGPAISKTDPTGGPVCEAADPAQAGTDSSN